MKSSPLSEVKRLFDPIDIASLVYFRVLFYSILLWEVVRFFTNDWIRIYYIEPQFHFSYYGLSWLQPWPDPGMYVHFIALGLLAFCAAIGLAYRVSSALFFLGFAYVFLLDQARYLNHFYLASLLSFLMMFVPAHRRLSVDVWLGRSVRSDWVPAWALYLLRAQLGIVYFYAGVAKINSDWLAGEPMRMALSGRPDFPLIGRFFAQEWMVYTMSYGGLLLDLFVVPFLLWRRTRVVAFVAALAFHLTNSQLFAIGIFPWFMIVATALFFAPDWPRRLLRLSPAPAGEAHDASRALIGLIIVYLIPQILLPLRHHLYPGNPAWTEEGHRFAWRMMLRIKQPREASFVLTDSESGRTKVVAATDYLPDWQARPMYTRPDMILQFAHELATKSPRPLEVRARVTCSLNGRVHQLLLDPDVDLAAEPRTLGPAPWILPLNVPLSQPKP